MNPGLLAAALILIAALIGAWLWLTRSRTLDFYEHSQHVQNPMQGFYTQRDTSAPERIARLVEDGVPLVLLAFNLNGYQDRPLDKDKLDELETALDTAVEYGLGIIFRAAYGFSEGRDTVEPEELERVVAHIGQIAPVLNRYANDLLCVQAGMLGPWGEWHSSALMGRDEEHSVLVRNAVTAAWLEGLEDGIIVQLRRPKFVRQAAEAGLPLERLGLHNDALLASDTDMNTYEEGARQAELAWVENNLPHGSFGGEMPKISKYTMAENAVAEFYRLHLTYLNSRYNTEVLDSWREQLLQGEDALDYIQRHMGSRLYLQNATLPQLMLTLGIPKTQYELRLANSGFAPAQSRLSYHLVFKQGRKVYHRPLTPEEIMAGGDGGVILRGQFRLFEEIKSEERFDIGIWVSYGAPDSGGKPYYLANEANDEIAYEGQILYFASYTPDKIGWRLQ